jgi:hypothetical protein
VSDRTTSAKPKTILVQFFADAFGFQRIFSPVKWLQNRERGPDQLIVGKDAAQTDQPVVGMNGYQSVDTIVRTQFVAPPAFGSRTTQSCAVDLSDFQKRFCSQQGW